MAGETTGAVRVVLRLEGLVVFLAALVAYGESGTHWSTFAWFILLPDLALLGYLASARAGAIAYNCTHSYIGAVACLAASQLFGMPLLLTAGLIWCAHLGFDRMLGYGLKYASGFRATHLGLVGKAA